MNALSLWNRGVYRNGDGRATSGKGVPFAAGFHREMDQLLDEVFNGFGFTRSHAGGAGWPVVEVQEDDDRFVVTADLPGLAQRDVEVSFREDVLTLRGERKRENKSSLYSERWAGSFERDITISPHIDADAITAVFRNGVLTVTLPKKPEVKPRRISIE